MDFRFSIFDFRLKTAAAESLPCALPNRKLKIPNPKFRRAVTFTEILFAVALLGIGFVLLAGMFPVAIQQTQNTVEEGVGANTAMAAVRCFEQVDPSLLVPTNGVVSPCDSAMWPRIAGNLVNQQDLRFAWVPLYRREPHWDHAQVIMIAVQCRNASGFGPADIVNAGSFPPNLMARPVDIAGLAADQVAFANPQTNLPDLTGGLAPGGFILIAEGSTAGCVYRLGTQIDRYHYYFSPGEGPKYPSELIPPSNVTVRAYFVGRGYDYPNMGASQPAFAGPAMDITAYTTIVPAR